MHSVKTGLAALALACGVGVAGTAQAQEVTVGYQLIFNPWKVAIADGTFQEETGRDIRFLRFDSGAKVITAMASGQVDIALAGSSPIAAGVSNGIDMQLFWIVEDIAAAEALVVRDGSDIDPEDPSTLEGKKIGVPFVSTTHFHMLFALEHWGIDPDSVTLLNMQPNDIAAAWARGDIDAGFVWNPALGRIKDTGEVMITSGELSELGRATFDGMMVMRDFAEANPEFMAQFVRVVAEADEAYRSNPEAFGADSENAQKIVDMVGGEVEEVPGVLELYNFPTMEEQVSEQWLGGGAAEALRYTSEFLQAQGRIDELLPDYSSVVTDEYVRAAMELN